MKIIAIGAVINQVEKGWKRGTKLTCDSTYSDGFYC